MKRLKPQTASDFKLVSDIVSYVSKCSPVTKNILDEDLDVTIDIIFNKDWKKARKVFGKPCIDCIMRYYIEQEKYEDCVPLRDVGKRIKAPV